MAKKTSLKYILLGLIRRKPRTGYELDQAFKKEVGEFWQAQHSQIYPELGKMEEQNLVRFEIEISGTKLEKKIYYLTESGEKDLRKWLQIPSEDFPINRDEFILKIFFLTDQKDPDLAHIIHEQSLMHAERLAYLQTRLTELFPTQEHIDKDFGHYLVLDRAISRETEYTVWLQKILTKLMS